MFSLSGNLEFLSCGQCKANINSRNADKVRGAGAQDPCAGGPAEPDCAHALNGQTDDGGNK